VFLIFVLMIFFIVINFSDGVLNPNGVRFGSAEIYNVGKILVKIVDFEFGVYKTFANHVFICPSYDGTYNV
jgi:hypothetical protein